MLRAKERPIIFSSEMVKAILDGRKSVTRRVVKPQPIVVPDVAFEDDFRFQMPDYHKNLWVAGSQISNVLSKECPYGQPGDRLWVRESFVLESNCGDYGDNEPPFKDGRPVKWDTENGPLDGNAMWLQAHYAATDPIPELVNEDCPFEKCSDDGCCQHWKPSIHMPRWASRLTLEVTGVRVERVQEISREGAIAEGCPAEFCDLVKAHDYAPRNWFSTLWDSLNESRGFGWDKNPWVWVVEFKVLSPRTIGEKKEE